MTKVLSFLLFVLLIGGLLSVMPEFQKYNQYSQSIKTKKHHFTVYNEWTIKKIDSLSAAVNKRFAVN